MAKRDPFEPRTKPNSPAVAPSDMNRLARETCISEAGLASALERGHKFCWRWSAPARFDRPIPVREMNISPRGCVLWSKCHDSPRTRLPPAGYLLARMQEILPSDIINSSVDAA